MLNKLTFLLAFIAGVIIFWGYREYTTLSELTFGKGSDGTTILCWEGNCAWTFVRPKEDLRKSDFETRSLTNTVTYPHPVQDVQPVIRYLPTIKNTYSPVGTFVFNDKYLAFVVNEETQKNDRYKQEWIMYIYNRSSKHISRVLSTIYPISVYAIEGNTLSFQNLNRLPNLETVDFVPPSLITTVGTKINLAARALIY